VSQKFDVRFEQLALGGFDLQPYLLEAVQNSSQTLQKLLGSAGINGYVVKVTQAHIPQ